MPALRRRRSRASGPRLRERVERVGGVVDALGERRARVRRAERDDVPDAGGEGAAVVAGAARDEPAHRVPDERDRLDRHRPRRHRGVEQRREVAAVAGDVAAGAVAHVERGGAEVARQPRAVPLRGERPGVLRLEQPVDEDDEAARGAGEVLGHARHPPVDAQRHRLVQRRALRLQPVAVQAAEHRERHRPAAGGRELARRERGAGGTAREHGGARDRGVRGAGDRVVGAPCGLGGRAEAGEDPRGDRGVDLPDAAGPEAELLAERPREGVRLAGHAVTLPGSAARSTRARCTAA